MTEKDKLILGTLLISILLLLTFAGFSQAHRITVLERKVQVIKSQEYQIVCKQRKRLVNVHNQIWGCMGVGQGLIKNKN